MSERLRGNGVRGNGVREHFRNSCLASLARGSFRAAAETRYRRKDLSMPARTQARIRRDLNRLAELIQKHADSKPSLKAIAVRVQSATDLVNSTWQGYQAAAVKADKERSERDRTLEQLVSWGRIWRPVVLLAVPGASENIRALPAGGATSDDAIRVVADLAAFIERNPGTADFRAAALGELGTLVEDARKEYAEAKSAAPEEDGARRAFSEAAISGNETLVRGTEVVRAVFGPKSAEYKQFIARNSPEEDDEDDKDTDTGET